MGSDKARLRVGRRTLLGHVRRRAGELGLPIRLIGKDVVERCGPLGGLLTSLSSSRRQAELFLACDMPFVSVAWLKRVLRESGGGKRAVFTEYDGMPGFPCLLPVADLARVQAEVRAGQLSLRNLSRVLGAHCLPVKRELEWRFFNVNTPEALEEARGIADRVAQACSQPVLLDGSPVEVGASVGVTLSAATSTASSLLAASDEAMYRAKRSGRPVLVH